MRYAEKRSPEKRSPEKWSLKNGTLKKKFPGKNPRKNVLKKLFSVKTMLRNLNFFIFINCFYYTHKKMFHVHLTILHTPDCTTLKESRKVCCLVLDFHRLITSQHSTHHNARRSPHNLLFPSCGFVVEF